MTLTDITLMLFRLVDQHPMLAWVVFAVSMVLNVYLFRVLKRIW